jgi:hypothetical protein
MGIRGKMRLGILAWAMLTEDLDRLLKD